MAATANWIKKKGYNSVSFKDIDLKFTVVVAEADPQNVVWMLN